MGTFRTVVRTAHANLGGFGSNTFHIRTTGLGGTDTAQVAEAMTAVQAFYGTARGIMPDTATISWDGSAAGVMANEGETKENTGWSTAGLVAGTSLPPANCVVIGWRTSSGGRSGRGRTFLGPITTAAAEANGTVVTTHLTQLRNSANALVTASTGPGEWAVCVYSPQDSVFRDITGSAVRDIFAVLRSRRD